VANFKTFFNGLIQIVKGVLNIIKGVFTGDFDLVRKGIEQVFSGLWKFISGGFKMVGAAVVIIFKGVLKLIYNMVKVLVDGIVWVAGKVSKLLGGNEFTFKMPSFKQGGIMPYTGVAYLHAGEKVIPRNEVGSGQVSFSPSITINAAVTSDYDVRRLASQLNEYWASDFQRMLKSRI